MKVITVQIEINDDTPIADVEQIIGEALNNEEVDCIYEIVKVIWGSMGHE